MSIEKRENLLKVSRMLLLALLIVAIIATVIDCIVQAIQTANVTIRDDIFETSISFDLTVVCVIYGIILLLEYGIYLGLKYLIFEKGQKVLHVIWEIFKSVCFLVVILYIFQIFH